TWWCFTVKENLKLISIGCLSGFVLALLLKLVSKLSGSTVFILLFEVDYMPVLNDLQPPWLIGTIFHFVTCALSILVLYHILRSMGWQKSYTGYMMPISVGSGFLYFLTYFSTATPAWNDLFSWSVWVLGHLIFSLIARSEERR